MDDAETRALTDPLVRQWLAERDTFLLGLGDALRAIDDADEVARVACRLLGEYLHADRVSYAEYRDGCRTAVLPDYCAPGLQSIAGSHRYPEQGVAARVRQAETVVIDDAEMSSLVPDDVRPLYRRLHVRSLMAVPLFVGGEVRSSLTVSTRAPRQWPSHEVALLQKVGDRTWGAVERCRAEARLRASEAQYRTLFDSIDEGFCVAEVEFDASGTAVDYRIVEMNPAFDRHTGLRDFVGKSVRAAIPDLEEFWFETYGRVAATGEPARFVHQAEAMGGRWFQVHAFRIGGDDSRRVAILFTDITERERGARAQREADRHKDEFLATLAHELRNPLAPVRHGLEILRRADDPVLRERTRAMMERQVVQMTHLIDDLMDVSRISRGQVVLQKTRLRLDAAIQDAIDTARPLIEAAGHQLTVDLPAAPVYVDGDRTRLAQVFANLLNNAAKYTATGGRIALTAASRDGLAEVTVADNGAGIEREALARVFDLFAQVDAALQQAHGGLGIGLHIVKRLVELHDGEIVADSDGRGRGSRFSVRLPAVPALSSETAGHGAESSGSAHAKRVLIVDDNHDGADSLALILTLGGHETRTAFTGEDALVVAETFRPDVVLMDIGLPGVDGYETCRRLRQRAWSQSTLIVAQTGWAQEADKRAAMAAGFDLHLTKPVEPSAVERVLAGARPRR